MPYPVVTEEQSPHKAFTDRQEAQRVADAITNAPRKGVARVQFTGAWNCWLVEVHFRSNPYGNAAVLREDGSLARYN